MALELERSSAPASHVPGSRLAAPLRGSPEKIVLVTRRTRLEDLVLRFNTLGQARFYIEHAGGDFAEYQAEHAAYEAALELVRRELELGLRIQVVDRSLVPTLLFAPEDLVVALGQDGLVANTAKYALGRPILGVNPDPTRFDGILLPFRPAEVRAALAAVVEGRHRRREITLAEARFGDGQRLLAFNDLYLGARTHVSARYSIGFRGRRESQSSSGVVVSTGAGSTGWMSSIFNMAGGVAVLGGGQPPAPVRLDWDDARLLFAVREPFRSRHSEAGIVAGFLEAGEELIVESRMPAGGVVFSDGVEADYVAFDAGAVVHLRAAAERVQLVVK